MTIPFLDLAAHHQPLRKELDAAIAAVIDKNAFAGGPFVESFESDFAAYCQCRHAIGVGNGTDALWLALLAMGVGPGDEVITVPNTFIATAEAISYCGAKPVFVDIDETTHTLDPNRIEAVITDKTKAIIPVHLYGQSADMDPIMQIAKQRGLKVVEDACQAHGADYKGRRAGSIGDAGCFSFYPGKNLGAFGEAGAVVTNNDDLAQTMRVLRDHGQSRKYVHKLVGWNARMDGIQGAVLKVKLKYLDAANEKRRAHAKRYDELLRGITGIVAPVEADYARHVYHLYVIRVQNRDAFIETMKTKGVSCAIHYPVPLHLQEAYAGLGRGPGSFPVSERVQSELVSLPMYPELTEEMVGAVVNEVRNVVKEGA